MSSLTLFVSSDNDLTDIIFRKLHQVLLSFSARFPATRDVIYKIDAFHFSAVNNPTSLLACDLSQAACT